MDPVLQEEATQGGSRLGTWGMRGTRRHRRTAVLCAQGCAARTKHHTTKIHFSRPKKACLLWEGISGCSLGPRQELDKEVSGWIPT